MRGGICGGTAGLRPVERMFESSKDATRWGVELGAVIDITHLGPKPTLDDLAAFLRPGQRSRVGSDIFRGEPTSLAGENGVEYWGWITQNMNQGLKSNWVFVAVQEVEK